MRIFWLLLLGLASTACASSSSPPVVAGGGAASCPDDTPRTSRFVAVAPNVQLEVLDWGGSGKTMVLLTGLGDTARVYDDFALQWTDFYHVIGITRRGYGLSSKPTNGYDIATRARDDVNVLDALGIRRAVFVGHSIAGEELSKIGTAYAARVDKLVYLDAYDYADRFKLQNDIPGAPYVESASAPSTVSMPQARVWKGSVARFRRSAKPTASIQPRQI